MAIKKPAAKAEKAEEKAPAKKAPAKRPASVVEFDGKNEAAVKKLAGGFFLKHDDGRFQVDAEWVDPGDFVIKATDGTVHVLNRA